MTNDLVKRLRASAVGMGVRDATKYTAGITVADAWEAAAAIEARDAMLRECARALRQIRDIGLGPDRGSGTWQAQCASEIARTTLAKAEEMLK